MTWAEVVDKMEIRGIPKLLPPAPGFKEPELTFFEAARWRWMGIATTKEGCVLCRQLEDGRWITVRMATEDDWAVVSRAFASEVTQ